MEEVISKLNGIFCDIFNDRKIIINSKTSAADIEQWDSLGHIMLVMAVEKAFGIRFTTAEIVELSKPDKNVGFLEALILEKKNA